MRKNRLHSIVTAVNSMTAGRPPIGLLAATIITAMTSGCSTFGPSTVDMEKAITASVVNDFPPGWSASIRQGTHVDVTTVKILKVGNYDAKSKFYPVEARVCGTYQDNPFFESPRERSFDQTAHFAVYQNEYVDWVASLRYFRFPRTF